MIFKHDILNHLSLSTYLKIHVEANHQIDSWSMNSFVFVGDTKCYVEQFDVYFP